MNSLSLPPRARSLSLFTLSDTLLVGLDMTLNLTTLSEALTVRAAETTSGLLQK
jgi:hypothetical protein